MIIGVISRLAMDRNTLRVLIVLLITSPGHPCRGFWAYRAEATQNTRSLIGKPPPRPGRGARGVARLAWIGSKCLAGEDLARYVGIVFLYIYIYTHVLT